MRAWPASDPRVGAREWGDVCAVLSANSSVGPAIRLGIGHASPGRSTHRFRLDICYGCGALGAGFRRGRWFPQVRPKVMKRNASVLVNEIVGGDSALGALTDASEVFWRGEALAVTVLMHSLSVADS